MKDCKTTIVDSIMGSGKTSWAIQYMNEYDDYSFIYVTPFLDEVKRIKDSCTRRVFKEPKIDKCNKMDNLLQLLNDGYNIVTTHALFKNMDERCLEYIKNNNYILILDEVIDVVEEVQIKKDDIDMLIRDKKIEVDEVDNRIRWIEENYDGSFNRYRSDLINGDCFLFNNTVIMWTFPIKILDLFDQTFVLTHMFEGSLQCNYYMMNNIEYDYKSVRKIEKGFGETKDRYELCDFYIPKIGEELRNKIHIYEGKLNDIGVSMDKRVNPLSKSWYQKKGKTNERCSLVKNNIYNYFKHVCKSKSNDNMWTTFKDYQNKCKGKGYSKGFVPLNARATNEFKDKTCLAYGINRYMSPILKNFFISKGVNVSEETYVTSEFIQWIFRSAIRDGKEINIYIPSERMRRLLNNYFDMLS